MCFDQVLDIRKLLFKTRAGKSDVSTWKQQYTHSENILLVIVCPKQKPLLKLEINMVIDQDCIFSQTRFFNVIISTEFLSSSIYPVQKTFKKLEDPLATHNYSRFDNFM